MSEKPKVQLTLRYVGPPKEYIRRLKWAQKTLLRFYRFECIHEIELPTEAAKKERRIYAK